MIPEETKEGKGLGTNMNNVELKHKVGRLAVKRSILVFIDGTICDDRHRVTLYGKPDFYSVESILNDKAVDGSVQCLSELSKTFNIIYIGARPEHTKIITLDWMTKSGFPSGEIYLSEKQEERLKIVSELSPKYNIVAGIGDRWDDNELHLQIGCMSIILEEYHGNWDTVRRYLLTQ